MTLFDFIPVPVPTRRAMARMTTWPDLACFLFFPHPAAHRPFAAKPPIRHPFQSEPRKRVDQETVLSHVPVCPFHAHTVKSHGLLMPHTCHLHPLLAPQATRKISGLCPLQKRSVPARACPCMVPSVLPIIPFVIPRASLLIGATLQPFNYWTYPVYPIILQRILVLNPSHLRSSFLLPFLCSPCCRSFGPNCDDVHALFCLIFVRLHSYSRIFTLSMEH